MKIDKEELHDIFYGIANDDETQFSVLYEKYNKLVYKIAFSILKNKENSEDVAQKVFLKIWKLDKDKLPTCNEASWLYSLTKNETLNYLRRIKDEIDIEDVYYISDEDDEINEFMNKDTYNKIISKLNKDEQEIISLKILSNLSFREISKILNIPIGTVQWKYYKSINNLKILLTNVSMFIITIGLFFAERRGSQTKKYRQAQSNLSIENSLQIIEPIKDKADDERKLLNQTKDETKEFNTIEETTKNEIKVNHIVNNEFISNETVEIFEIDINQTNKLNKIEIGTLILSSIFLSLSLICLIKYTNVGKIKK